MKQKIIICVVRTGGALLLLVVLALVAKWLEWSYEDVRVVLGIFNAFFPEFVALALFGAVALVFYRASATDNDFNFIHFFIAGKPEDVGKLVYFLFAMAIFWSYFALYWREKLTTEYVVGTGALFLVQSVAAITGKAFGKQRPEETK